MTEGKNYSGQLVFGLDIGTRSVVGTVEIGRASCRERV